MIHNGFRFGVARSSDPQRLSVLMEPDVWSAQAAGKQQLPHSQESMAMKVIARLSAIVLAAGMFGLFAGSATLTVSVVTDERPGLAARHGLAKLAQALRAKGWTAQEVTSLGEARGDLVVVSGLATGNGTAARLLASQKIAPPEGPESLLIQAVRANGKRTLLFSGSDDRGLMYPLLDVAERAGWSSDAKNPLSDVRDARETPYSPERALSVYTMHRAHFEQRFFNEDYWARYFDTLARCRFNTFVLIFGYENAGYFAPRIRTSSMWKDSPECGSWAGPKKSRNATFAPSIA